MIKKRIITIAGRPGSGKSTTAKAAAAQLGYRHFSSGDLYRELGRKRGVDVLAANQPGVTEELDEQVDSKLREIGAKDDRLVIDSRTAWHWIPDSFKVFLDLDADIAAQRILKEKNDSRLKSETIHEDPAEYSKILNHRLKIETDRYKALYDIDPYDMANYDLVIDTATNNTEQVIGKVVKAYKSWLNN